MYINAFVYVQFFEKTGQVIKDCVSFLCIFLTLVKINANNRIIIFFSLKYFYCLWNIEGIKA